MIRYTHLGHHVAAVSMGIVLMFVCSLNVQSQNVELPKRTAKAMKYLDEAVDYFQRRNSEEATKYLNKALKSDSLLMGAWMLKGDIYQQEKKPDLALSAYQKAMSIDSLSFPQMYFTVGNLAYNQGNYTLSVAYYSKYLEQAQLDSHAMIGVQRALRQSQLAVQLVNSPMDIRMENMGDTFNSPEDEYMNFANAEENRLVITRKSNREVSREHQPLFEERFFVSTLGDSCWIQPVLMDIPWLNSHNVGGMSMSADGRSMLFTGCYWPEGHGSCDLYYSNRLGNQWMEPKSFNRQINTSGWESQPVITADGQTIYFSSKRSGGRGGADLWKTVYQPGKGWTTPINLGDSINTEADEMAPFIHGDGHTLYFSSNGHPGLGGFDLFVAHLDSTGQWGKVANMGVPLNSSANDLNVFVGLQGGQGWISSDRPGGQGGMDIWNFDMPAELAPQPVLLLAGKVVDSLSGLPLKAEVEITVLTTGIQKQLILSDSLTGEFLVVLNPDIPYLFNISKKGYLFYSQALLPEDSPNNQSLEKIYPLQPIVKGASLNLYHVNFNFNSDTLLTTSFAELKKLSALLTENPQIKVDIVGHTDSIGSGDFNKTLSEKRANAVQNYLLDQGIASERMTAHGVGDWQPVATNETEAGRALNRRTEIIIR